MAIILPMIDIKQIITEHFCCKHLRYLNMNKVNKQKSQSVNSERPSFEIVIKLLGTKRDLTRSDDQSSLFHEPGEPTENSIYYLAYTIERSGGKSIKRVASIKTHSLLLTTPSYARTQGSGGPAPGSRLPGKPAPCLADTVLDPPRSQLWINTRAISLEIGSVMRFVITPPANKLL